MINFIAIIITINYVVLITCIYVYIKTTCNQTLCISNCVD